MKRLEKATSLASLITFLACAETSQTASPPLAAAQDVRVQVAKIQEPAPSQPLENRGPDILGKLENAMSEVEQGIREGRDLDPNSGFNLDSLRVVVEEIPKDMVISKEMKERAWAIRLRKDNYKALKEINDSLIEIEDRIHVIGELATDAKDYGVLMATAQLTARVIGLTIGTLKKRGIPVQDLEERLAKINAMLEERKK